MKRITDSDRVRIEKIYRAMKLAGLNKPQLELLEVNLENLIAEKNKSKILGKDISPNLSAAGVLPQKNEIVQSENLEKCGKPASESPAQKFLNAVMSGNIQCQKQELAILWRRQQESRKRIGGHTLPRSRFLEEAQRFVESQGLVFDKQLHKMHFDK